MGVSVILFLFLFEIKYAFSNHILTINILEFYTLRIFAGSSRPLVCYKGWISEQGRLLGQTRSKASDEKICIHRTTSTNKISPHRLTDRPTDRQTDQPTDGHYPI